MAERPDEVPPARSPDVAPTHGGPGRPPAAAGKPAAPTWVAMSGLGFEFVGAILVPGALGWWLDRRFDTAPWIMLALGLLGFVVGLRLLMRTVNRPTRR